MGQQQLLLIVLGTIIVGVAVVVGINMFTTGAINAERDALLQDVNNIASNAISYWRKPAALGGGARTFIGVTFAKIGVDASNVNGVFEILVSTILDFDLKATGSSEGVTVDVTIDKDGIVGVPTIVMP